MSEATFLILLGYDKTIANPVNRNEVFSCSDIYQDFKKCRALARRGQRGVEDCKEIRDTGRKCFSLSEKDFQIHLIEKFENKRKYLEYLKANESYLYNVHLSNPKTFSISVYHEEFANEFAKDVNTKILNNIKN